MDTQTPQLRRDFLYYATAGTGAVAVGAAVWPLLNQMNPSADVRALSQIRVDISGVEPGTQLTVSFLGKPVFIRRRTQEEIDAARAVTMDDPPVLIALIAPFALLLALCIAGDGDAESESSSERISLRWSSPPAKRDVAASRADATIFSADASTAATK